VTPQDIADLAPTHVVFGGLLHHVDDRDATPLLTMAQRSPRLERIVTNDIDYLPREPISNLLARLDRRRFCRHEVEYRSHAERSGLRVVESAIERSHPTRGLAKYFMRTLAPRSSEVPASRFSRTAG
jgi:hypothetical protein